MSRRTCPAGCRGTGRAHAARRRPARAGGGGPARRRAGWRWPRVCPRLLTWWPTSPPSSPLRQAVEADRSGRVVQERRAELAGWSGPMLSPGLAGQLTYQAAAAARRTMRGGRPADGSAYLRTKATYSRRAPAAGTPRCWAGPSRRPPGWPSSMAPMTRSPGHDQEASLAATVGEPSYQPHLPDGRRPLGSSPHDHRRACRAGHADGRLTVTVTRRRLARTVPTRWRSGSRPIPARYAAAAQGRVRRRAFPRHAGD
jgi:hypothetical protein